MPLEPESTKLPDKVWSLNIVVKYPSYMPLVSSGQHRFGARLIVRLRIDAEDQRPRYTSPPRRRRQLGSTMIVPLLSVAKNGTGFCT